MVSEDRTFGSHLLFFLMKAFSVRLIRYTAGLAEMSCMELR